MRISQPPHTIFAIIIIIFSLNSCTTTTTRIKAAALTISNDSMARDVNSLILNQEVNIHGVENTTDGKTNTELTISIINPQNLPADTSEQNQICEQVASLFKHALKDRAAYDVLKVLLVHRVTDGSVTKSFHYGRSFKSGELNTYTYVVTLGNQLDSSTSRAFGKTIFSKSDATIISVFTYYNTTPDNPIAFKLYKDTDTAHLLLTTRSVGKTVAGNVKLVNKLTVADIYKVPQMSSGDYRIEYVVANNVVGSRRFKLL
jgi:hypothetical protein